MMDKAGVKDTHRRYLTGHAQVAQDGSYVLPTQEALLDEYLKAEDLLTINPTHRLRKENQELKSTQAQEIAFLKKELDTTREEYRNVLVIMDQVRTDVSKMQEQEEQHQKVLEQRMERTRRYKRALEDPDPEHRSNFIMQELESNPPKHLPPWLAARLHLPAAAPDTTIDKEKS
jgi:hypothetical protein